MFLPGNNGKAQPLTVLSHWFKPMRVQTSHGGRKLNLLVERNLDRSHHRCPILGSVSEVHPMAPSKLSNCSANRMAWDNSV